MNVKFRDAEWIKLRKSIINRDKRRCLKCKARVSLTVHHIKPRDAGGSSHPANLVTLCSPCHDWAEVETAERGLTWVELISPPEPKEDEGLKRIWYRDDNDVLTALLVPEDTQVGKNVWRIYDFTAAGGGLAIVRAHRAQDAKAILGAYVSCSTIKLKPPQQWSVSRQGGNILYLSLGHY